MCKTNICTEAIPGISSIFGAAFLSTHSGFHKDRHFLKTIMISGDRVHRKMPKSRAGFKNKPSAESCNENNFFIGPQCIFKLIHSHQIPSFMRNTVAKFLQNMQTSSMEGKICSFIREYSDTPLLTPCHLNGFRAGNA